MALGKAKGNDKRSILKCFGNPKATKRDLQTAVRVIQALGIEDNIRGQALKYSDRAQRSLKDYSGSAKEELVALLDFVVKRTV